jgi:RimJ/RimL family protein N-acetyltransferase
MSSQKGCQRLRVSDITGAGNEEMKPPETFLTNRLCLRPPVLSDAESIHSAYATDPEVTRYLIWQPHKHIEETNVFLRRCVEGWLTGSEFPWAITLKESGELIGMVGLRIREFKADLGYCLARKFWGKGFVTEAATPIARWALAQPEIYRVWAMCDVDNLASARVLEKLGMTREGIMRRSQMHPAVSDKPRDSYCYAMVK